MKKLLIAAITGFAIIPALVHAHASLIDTPQVDYHAISPNGDGVQDSSLVTVKLDSACDTLAITLEDSTGTVVIDSLLFVQNADTGYTAECYWTGRDSLHHLLDEGKYSLHVFASDGTTSEHNTMSVFVDITSPLVDISHLYPGIYLPGMPGEDDSVKIYYSISSSRYNDSLALKITPPLGVPYLLEQAVPGNGNYISKWGEDQNTADGIYNVRMEASDHAGNSDYDLSGINVDTAAPQIEFYSPYPSGTVNQSADILTGYCYDRNGIDPSSLTMTWNESDALTPDSTFAGADTLKWWIAIGDSISLEGEYLDGEYSITVDCKDTNSREGSRELSFRIDTTPPNPPYISAPSQVRNDPVVVVTVTADPLDDTEVVEIYRYHGGDTTLAERDESILDENTDIEISGLEEGDNQIWAVAFDQTDNSSGISNVISVDYSIITGMYFPEVFREPDQFRIITKSMAAGVEIEIFTLNGEKVVSLRDRSPATDFRIYWDLNNGNGEEVRNGVYLCVIKVTSQGREVTEKDFIAVVR